MKQKDVNSYILENNGHNPFKDFNYLKSRTFKGARALLAMKE
jgi:hypothetical protein